jgi:hypothetical protein
VDGRDDRHDRESVDQQRAGLHVENIDVGLRLEWPIPVVGDRCRRLNNRYAVNVGLIDVSQGTQTSTGVAKSAVWAIAAGPNDQLETGYAQAINTALQSGDDVAVRIQ